MVFFRVLSLLPLSVLHGISDFVFFLIYYVARYRKKVVLDNLRQAFPEKTETERRKIARSFYRNLTDLMVETLKALTMPEEEMRRRVKLKNYDILEKHIRNGKVVFVMLGHQINWEWVSHIIRLQGIPVDVIYKPLSNDFFERFMLAIRSRFGIHPVSMYTIFRDMVSRRNEARVIGTLADQAPHHPDSAYWTTFFHQETDFFNGTEKMARKFQTPLLLGRIRKVRRGYYEFELSPVAEPPYAGIPAGELTERYVRWLEDTLREQPDTWLWSHKRWKHKREEFLTPELA